MNRDPKGLTPSGHGSRSTVHALLLLDTLLRHLFFQRGGDGGVEAGPGAGVLLAFGGDVVVALLLKRDDLVAQFLALGEPSLDLLRALSGRELLQVGGQVFGLHLVEFDRLVLD